MLAVMARNMLEKSRLCWVLRSHQNQLVTGEMSEGLQLNDEGSLHACLYL